MFSCYYSILFLLLLLLLHHSHPIDDHLLLQCGPNVASNSHELTEVGPLVVCMNYSRLEYNFKQHMRLGTQGYDDATYNASSISSAGLIHLSLTNN